MSVVLTADPSDRGTQPTSGHQDCACDCQCACPTDGLPVPVLSLPVAYYLELTPACNNHCPGCGNVHALPGLPEAQATGGRPDRRLTCFQEAPMPLDGPGWGDLIAHLSSHARQFKLTGGEPTLHPDFEAIVGQVERAGIPFALFTNGRWADPDRLIELLARTGAFEGFLISLHGPNADAHEAFSGLPGSFDETVGNVHRATEARLDVAISLVIHRLSFDRVEETLDLALRLGANHLVCNRLIGAPLEGLTPTEAQLRSAISTIESLRAHGKPIRFGNCIPHCFAPSSARGCTAGSTFATVDPWGRVRPCNHAPLVVGDLLSQPVRAIWQGEEMNRWRALLPAGCLRCAALATCHGGCRAQAMLLGQARDPLVGRPLDPASLPPQPELCLFEGLRPLGSFVRRSEGSLDVVLSQNTVVPVPPACISLASRLDGSLTLRQIEGQYGPTALDWVGSLHQEGMVAWASG